MQLPQTMLGEIAAMPNTHALMPCVRLSYYRALQYSKASKIEPARKWFEYALRCDPHHMNSLKDYANMCM